MEKLAAEVRSLDPEADAVFEEFPIAKIPNLEFVDEIFISYPTVNQFKNIEIKFKIK